MLGRQLAPPLSTRPWCEVITDLEARHRAQTGPRWHLVQVAGGERDAHAVKWLKYRGYEPYYPMIRSLRPVVPMRQLSKKQRKALREGDLTAAMTRVVLRPFLHRYCFCRFDPRSRGWQDVLKLSGVTGLMTRAGAPVMIADALIEGIRAKEVDGAIPGGTPAAEVLLLGQLVEVTDGPLAGYRGIIAKIRTVTIEGLDTIERLTVAVEIFGRLTPTELDANQVAPANISAIR